MPAKDIRVVDRGSFFDDAFFRDSWEDFDKAMKNVLDGHGTKTDDSSRSQCQDMYRQLRTNRIDQDMYASQAVQVTEKDGKFQVVLDVKDFNPRDLQVKVVDDKIVLEGRYDKVSEDGKSSSSKAFYREFNLPNEADIDQVSTALSKDGILTIKAPRKDGLPSIPGYERSASQASHFIQEALNDQRYGKPSSKNTRSFTNTSSNMETCEGFENMSKDLKERLMFNDRDSGRSTASGSPCPSAFSNTPSCTSSAPSDFGSEYSKHSTDYNINKKPEANIYQRYEPNYSERTPSEASFRSGTTQSSMDGNHYAMQNFTKPNVARVQSRPVAATGSGGTASISVKEEDGKRTTTSEKTSLVQENDGYLESKEVSAEVSEKDSQAARRESSTRMMKHDEDPAGKFKKSEAADASDVSETCVKQLPDGSTVTVKKSSTSTSNFKTSFSSGSGGPMQMPSLFNQDLNSGMNDFGAGFMGRGSSLMNQMSSDSLASNMSAFSDMSNFPRMSDFSNMSSFSNNPFPSAQGFNDFPDGSQRQGFPNFPPMNQFNNQSDPNSSTNSNFSTSHKTFNSSFENKKN